MSVTGAQRKAENGVLGAGKIKDDVIEYSTRDEMEAVYAQFIAREKSAGR